MNECVLKTTRGHWLKKTNKQNKHYSIIHKLSEKKKKKHDSTSIKMPIKILNTTEFLKCKNNF